MTSLTRLRIAVVHEWFAPVGGSEQVSLQMAAALDADLWALWDEAPDSGRRRPLQSSIAGGPRWLRRRALALPLTPWVWRRTKTPRYDVVVTSSHALGHTARLRSSPDARYLSYVHTPARYLWNPELDDRGAPWYLAAPRAILKPVDRRMSRHVSSYACNSEEVRRRILQAWGRDAVVIHPPVDTDFYHPVPVDPGQLPGGVTAGEFLLAAGRWVPYKRTAQAVTVADRAGLPLVVAGGGPDEAEIRRRADAARVPVHVVIDPSREELRTLYSAAGALVFPGLEDFGMVPVEAQACGTPVVAPDAGGVRESVISGVTGFLVSDDPESLARAALEAVRLPRAAVRENALRFSHEEFRRKIVSWVESVVT